MNKAFIFDMDGVIVDSERTWKIHDDAFLRKTLGKEVFEKMGSIVGLSVNSTYERAVSHGASIDKEEFSNKYNEAAANIYSKAPITEGVEKLASFLITKGFRLGLVTSSQKSSIDCVITQLSFRDHLDTVISLNDRPDLKPKPNPDGYLEAFKCLNADAKRSIILEDSNYGIAAAKATGAYVVGYRGNLIEGYEQRDANDYADTMNDVITLVEKFITQP